MDEQYPQPILREVVADAKPFNVDRTKNISLVELLFGKGARVIHPCTVFAERAGYPSWAAALEAMRGGKVVTAQGPLIGTSMMDFQMFERQVREDGLIMASPPHNDFGLVMVGFEEHFPADLLARFERQRIDAYERRKAMGL
jgi:hypothetical protein